MVLTDKEKFRCGFLSYCAGEGITPVEIRERVKVATAMVKQGSLASVAALLAQAPLAAAFYGLTSAAGAGALGGHVAAKMTDQEIDPAEVKRQELLAVYRQQADRARRNAARIRYREPVAVPKQPKLF